MRGNASTTLDFSTAPAWKVQTLKCQAICGGCLQLPGIRINSQEVCKWQNVGEKARERLALSLSRDGIILHFPSYIRSIYSCLGPDSLLLFYRLLLPSVWVMVSGSRFRFPLFLLLHIPIWKVVRTEMGTGKKIAPGFHKFLAEKCGFSCLDV